MVDHPRLWVYISKDCSLWCYNSDFILTHPLYRTEFTIRVSGTLCHHLILVALDRHVVGLVMRILPVGRFTPPQIIPDGLAFLRFENRGIDVWMIGNFYFDLRAFPGFVDDESNQHTIFRQFHFIVLLFRNGCVTLHFILFT